jgi:hypothetical protein
MPPKTDSPLWLHKGSNQWAKKFRGHIHYFGTDLNEALKRYRAEWDDIVAGREPKVAEDGGVRLHRILNAWLAAKLAAVEADELTRTTWNSYFRLSEWLTALWGRERSVGDLRPEDFGTLRIYLAEKYSPEALSLRIKQVRGVFSWASRNGILEVPMRYGTSFDMPPKRVMRLARAERGERLLPREDIRKLLDIANPPMRAAILLGVNGAMGEADLRRIAKKHLSKKGWLLLPRSKTGVMRSIPLWKETQDALAEIANRAPIFPWAATKSPDPASLRLKRLAKKAKVTIPKGSGFYIFRRCFRTAADGLADRRSVDGIMGHIDRDMGANYVERIEDARLEAVVGHVRQWLFGS